MVDAVAFLVNIFGDDWERVWVAEVQGDPGTMPWSGGLAKHKAALLNGTASLFFSVSSLKEGANRRRIENVDKVHVLVLDDVGSKADRQKILDLLGPPTYRVETSQGNEQWGYVYREPLEGSYGLALHTAIMGRLADLGLSDRIVDTTRLVRLPLGLNTKPSRNNWPVSLLEADWTRTFEPLDIAMDIGLSGQDIQNVPTKARALDLGSGGRQYEDDLFLEVMTRAGIVRGTRTNGTVVIECPWEDQHTVAGGDGTAYLGKMRFKCQHAHCSEKSREEFQCAVEDMISERLSGGLVPGCQIVARAGFAAGLDGADQDVIGSLSKAGSYTGFAEALDDLVYVDQAERFFRVSKRRLISPKAVDALCRLVHPPGSSGVKAAHNILLRNPVLKHVDGFTFRPGLGLYVWEKGGEAVNEWQGNAGLVEEDAGPELDLILGHIKMLVPDDVERKVLEQWLAHQVQKPGVKVPWMPVILGSQGTGKDLLLQALKYVLGPWNVSDVTTNDLSIDYNPWIKAQVIVVQELSSSHRFDLYNKLKPLIAAPPMMVSLKDKYEKALDIPNVQNWIATTNNEGAAAITADDRRLWVVNSPAVAQDGAYYDALGRATVTGAGQFLKWLREYDLTGWDWNRVPNTAGSVAAKEVMAREAASPDVQKVMDLLETVFAGRDIVLAHEVNKALGGKWSVSSRAIGEAMRLAGGVQWQQGRKLRMGSEIVRPWCLGTGAKTLASYQDGDEIKQRIQKQIFG